MASGRGPTTATTAPSTCATSHVSCISSTLLPSLPRLIWPPLPTDDTKTLITASADSSVRLWDVMTGRELFKFAYREPCRAVSLSVGEQMAVVTTDAFIGSSSTVHVLK